MINLQNRLYNNQETVDNIERVSKFLNQLSRDRFYGVVELQFQEGELILVRKQETIKPGLLVIIE